MMWHHHPTLSHQWQVSAGAITLSQYLNNIIEENNRITLIHCCRVCGERISADLVTAWRLSAKLTVQVNKADVITNRNYSPVLCMGSFFWHTCRLGYGHAGLSPGAPSVEPYCTNLLLPLMKNCSKENLMYEQIKLSYSQNRCSNINCLKCWREHG